MHAVLTCKILAYLSPPCNAGDVASPNLQLPMASLLMSSVVEQAEQGMPLRCITAYTKTSLQHCQCVGCCRPYKRLSAYELAENKGVLSWKMRTTKQGGCDGRHCASLASLGTYRSAEPCRLYPSSQLCLSWQGFGGFACVSTGLPFSPDS